MLTNYLLLPKFSKPQKFSSFTAMLVMAVGIASAPNISLGNKLQAARMVNHKTDPNKLEQRLGADKFTKLPDHAQSHIRTATKLAGKFSFNYTLDDTGADQLKHRRKYGDWKFNAFVLDLQGKNAFFDYKLEHVWYNGKNANFYHFLETYLSHKFANDVVMQVGNVIVPFGNLAQLSWWKNLNFYAGFDENYQTGFKFMHHACPWGIQLQLGKNSLVASNNAYSKTPKLTTGIADPNTTTGTSYSPELRQNNEDNLQLTARVTHWHQFNDHTKLEVGSSVKVGNTYNAQTTRRGSHVAGAFHINGWLDRWQIQLQFLPYGYSLKTEGYPAYNTVQLGKDGFVYTIPAKANIYSAAIAYKIPVNWQHLEDLTVYNDYSTLRNKQTVRSSQMNILGFKLTSGPLFVTTDLIAAKNMYGVGQTLDPATRELNVFNIGSDNLAANGGDGAKSKWKTKFNVNFGAKF